MHVRRSVFTRQFGEDLHLQAVACGDAPHPGGVDKLAERARVRLALQQRDDHPGQRSHHGSAKDASNQRKDGRPRQLPASPQAALRHHVPGVLVEHDSHQEEDQRWDPDGSQAVEVVPPGGTRAIKGEDVVDRLARYGAQCDEAIEHHHIFAFEEEGHKLEVLSHQRSSSHGGV